jgi:thiamine-monophosphate kinase
MKSSEDQLVDWIKEHAIVSPELCPIGIGDDMAQIRWDTADSVCITTDLLLEGVHFDLSGATLEQVGYKAMAVSLSDCAAMATIPVAAVVSVGLPAAFGIAQVQQLHNGLLKAGQAFDCMLVGGDTTRWRQAGLLTVNVAMLSRPPLGRSPVTRHTARVGDVIAVTGQLGGSLSGWHLDFIPRVREALRLVELTEIHAMMDLSDGLSSDLNRLCRASGVGARVQNEWIPITPAALTGEDPWAAAFNDGEDFELLFTLTPENWRTLQDTWDRSVPLTAIGTIQAGSGVVLRDSTGHESELPPLGYDHLGGRT